MSKEEEVGGGFIFTSSRLEIAQAVRENSACTQKCTVALIKFRIISSGGKNRL